MFLPKIPEATGTSSMLTISSHKDEYSTLFMHASIIQGFLSGIIAGQMIGESIFSGLKHSVIMMITAYILFTRFV